MRCNKKLRTMKEVPGHTENYNFQDIDETEFQQTTLKIKALERFYSINDSNKEARQNCLIEIMREQDILSLMRSGNQEPEKSRPVPSSQEEEATVIELFRKKKEDILSLQVENKQLRMKAKLMSDKVKEMNLLNHRMQKYDQKEKMIAKCKLREKTLLQEELALTSKCIEIHEFMETYRNRSS